MGIFFVYILKSSFCLVLFYLFYRLLLSKETFHRFNRIAILSILVLALLVPFCEATIHQETEITQTVLSIEQLLMLANYSDVSEVLPEQTSSFTCLQILIMVYFLGILFFICRNLYSLIRMLLLVKAGKKEKIGSGVTLIVHDKNSLSPFSWMNYVVISEKDLEENGREILIHELAHIKNRHSLDLLFTEICAFFQWFNPAVWLLKQELQNIHEYEADETVIKEGVNAKQYQLLLIKKAVGTRLYSMANSFNHSKLKKRITMMLKEKSSPWARLKYLYVLPVAAIAITAFARPEISNELEEISAVKVNDLTAIVEVKVQETPVKAPEIEEREKETPKVTQTPKKKKESDEDKKETDKKVEKTTKIDLKFNDKNGSMTVKADDAAFVVTDTIISSNKSLLSVLDGVNEENQPLLIINGILSPLSTLSTLDVNTIESIAVLKDANSTSIYGDRGANGVIVVELIRNGVTAINLLEEKKETSDIYKIGGEPITVKGTVVNEKGMPIYGATIILRGTEVGAITDKKGRFELRAPDYAILTILSAGMKDQVTNARKKLKIVMESK